MRRDMVGCGAGGEAAAAAAGGRRLRFTSGERVRRRRRETPEKISSSVPFDIQNKLEIIQRWRREDELWEAVMSFFGKKKEREEREGRDRGGEREREMKKMAKAP